jgi:hypothetical protein
LISSPGAEPHQPRLLLNSLDGRAESTRACSSKDMQTIGVAEQPPPEVALHVWVDGESSGAAAAVAFVATVAFLVGGFAVLLAT